LALGDYPLSGHEQMSFWLRFCDIGFFLAFFCHGTGPVSNAKVGPEWTAESTILTVQTAG